MVLDESKIVFIDEMGVNCSMRQRYGRSLVGLSPRKTVSTVRAKNFSVCAAMMKNKMLNFQISERAFNNEISGEYLEDLFTELNNIGLFNTILVMDNCPMHKVNSIRNQIEEAGHRAMFLPPYTPN
jgi:hypothetical protein